MLSGNRDGRIEFRLLRLVELKLLGDDLRRLLGHLGWRHERLSVGQGLEAGRAGQEAKHLGAVFLDRRCEARLVDLDQQLAGLDDLAFTDEDLGHEATVDALQDLELAGRDDLAVAARDFIDPGDCRPEDENHEDDAQRAQQHAGTQRLLADHGEIGIGSEIDRLFVLAIGQATEHLLDLRLGAVGDGVEAGLQRRAEILEAAHVALPI